MNVVVLNDHLYPDGGADVVALSSAEQLSRLGANVTLFVADKRRPDDTAERPYRLVCTGQDDLMHGSSVGRSAMQGLWNATAARELKKVLSAHNPDDTIVHLHSWTKSLSSSVARVAVDSGFPTVCTLHDYFSMCPTGGMFDFQQGRICRREPMSLDCMSANCDTRRYSHKLYRVARQIVQLGPGLIPRAFKEVIVVSRFSEKILAGTLAPGTVRTLVRNPIEVDKRPAADVARSTSFVVVARLSKFKGQKYFLEASQRAGVSAVCVGEGEDRRALEREYPEARFTGQLPRKDVVDIMASSRALVFPSLWYETQGLVVDEAAALGVPSIVTDTSAATDSVIHEETGLICPAGDSDALARALQRMNEEPGLASRLGRNAYDRFWSNPSTPKAHAESLLDVYRQIMLRARQSAPGMQIA